MLMADVVEHMLTTVDNPFDPFTQYDEWLVFDEQQGYFTNALLARVVHTSEELSDEVQAKAIEAGISEIVALNPNGMYKSVPEDLDALEISSL